MKLSIILPIHNEEATLHVVVQAAGDVCRQMGVPAELILIDDGSGEATRRLIDEICTSVDPVIRCVRHPIRLGKGAALRSGIAASRGEIIVFQDGDLEYDPGNYKVLLEPITSGKADVVYGSRFLRGGRPQGHSRLFYVANSFLTLLSNVLSKVWLTDMETGAKAFRRSVLERILIEENGFGVEPELTAKMLRLVRKEGLRFTEIPIQYRPRTYADGKKIRFQDGVWAILCILKYNLRSR